MPLWRVVGLLTLALACVKEDAEASHVHAYLDLMKRVTVFGQVLELRPFTIYQSL